jgi:hypothetical protein
MAKAKKVKGKKKRRLSPVLKAWNKCWKEIGVCPLTDKVTPKDKAKARACVERKMGKKAKRA